MGSSVDVEVKGGGTLGGNLNLIDLNDAANKTMRYAPRILS